MYLQYIIQYVYLGDVTEGVTWPPCSLGRSTVEGVVLKTAAPDAEPRQPGAFTLRESLGLVGPTVQLLSILTSPLEKGDCLHPTDSWSDFSVDLSTMVIVHCCKRQGKLHLNILLKIYIKIIVAYSDMLNLIPHNTQNFSIKVIVL